MISGSIRCVIKEWIEPKTVAVVGASRDPKKLGALVFKNLLQTGYAGRLIPVNPAADEVMGHEAYSRVSKIPGKVDLAVIVVPAGAVASVIRDLGKKKVALAVIISAGFKEVGEEGIKLEADLVKLARKMGVRFIGPNCLGFMNPLIGLNATFSSTLPRPGTVSFISQSGAMGVATLDWATESRLGFRAFVSIGNHADINEIDLLEYFGQDPKTKVILLYLESFTDGRRFVEIASRITPFKPVVVVKAGRTYKSLQAIQTHTGSLAGSAEIADQALKQAGVLVARTTEELFDYALSLSLAPRLKTPSVGIVTNAGGPGVLAVDELRHTKLIAPELHGTTVRALRKFIPPAGSTHNPIDVLGDAPASRFIRAAETTLKDQNVGGLIAVVTPQTTTDVDAIATGLSQLKRKTTKPIVTTLMGGEHVEFGRGILHENGLPEFATPERAIGAMNALRWGSPKARVLQQPKEGTKKLPHKFTRPGAQQLHPLDVHDLLKPYGFKIVKTHLITHAEDLWHVEFPAVMKVATAKIIHKKAVGGVAFVHNLPAAQQAFAEMMRVTKEAGGKASEGVLVQPEIEGGTEIMLGAKRDPAFGIIVLVGLGGVFVEVAKDTALRLGPVDKDLATEMVSSLRVVRHLTHQQHTQIVHALVQMSKLMYEHPQIVEIDVNPLSLTSQGPLVLDARVFTTIEAATA